MKSAVLSSLRIVCCIGICIALSECTHLQPVSKDEASALAKKIEKSIKDKDPSVLNTLLDPEEFASKVDTMVHAKMSSKTRKEVKEGIRNAKFGTEILAAVGDWGTYKLVKQYEQNHVQHLLFRVRGLRGINYNDFELIKKNGRVKAADVFIYLTGEFYTRTVAELLEQNPDEANGGVDAAAASIDVDRRHEAAGVGLGVR